MELRAFYLYAYVFVRCVRESGAGLFAQALLRTDLEVAGLIGAVHGSKVLNDTVRGKACRFAD